MKVTGLISIQGEVSIPTEQEGMYRNRTVNETVVRQIGKWRKSSTRLLRRQKNQEPQEADLRGQNDYNQSGNDSKACCFYFRQ